MEHVHKKTTKNYKLEKKPSKKKCYRFKFAELEKMQIYLTAKIFYLVY